MTRDDITRMAHEAGMVPHRPFTLAHLRDFAALVAAAEREACARVCQTQWSTEEERAAGRLFAAEIRARGNK